MCRLVVLFVVLVLGFIPLWGIIVGGGSANIYLLLFDRPQDREEAIVDVNNRILIQTRVGAGTAAVRYRTLDGEVLGSTDIGVRVTTRMSAPTQTPRFSYWPIPWEQRLAGLSDHRGKTQWMLIRNAERPGRAYIAAYDTVSKLPIGYIGRRGFRTSLPPETDWFDVEYQVLNWGSNVVASTGGISYGQLSHLSQTLPDEMLGYFVFIKDGDTISEINLRERTVRRIAEIAGLYGIGIVQQRQPSPMLGRLSTDPSRGGFLVLARARERLILVNSVDETQVHFELPPDLAHEPLSVRVLGSDQIMLEENAGYWESGRVVRFITMTPEGIEHEEIVQLLGGLPTDPRRLSLITAYTFPAAGLWLLEASLLAPFRKLEEYQADSYMEALRQSYDETWPGLVLLLLLSILLASIVYRWQQKYSRPNTPLWTTLVFLTTVPGFLAYWAMHRRPPLAACSHCGKEVPHNRDACPRCAEPFPEPKLLGTEIFA